VKPITFCSSGLPISWELGKNSSASENELLAAACMNRGKSRLSHCKKVSLGFFTDNKLRAI
jgi:hypothetical protein